MKLVSAILSLSLLVPLLAIGQGLPVSTPTGLWDFSNSTSIGQATVGPNLVIEGTTPAYAATRADDGGTSMSGVIATVGGTANRLRLTHGIPANGGGAKVNKYTFLFDEFSPTASRSSWRCFFQTDPTNGSTNDGEYFVRNTSDALGRATIGYSAASNETRWSRVVIVVDLPTSIKTYVNGSLFYNHTAQSLDNADYSLASQVLLFADNNAENASLNVGTVALWGKALTAAEVLAIGGAGAPILGATLPNQAPVITQGTTYAMPDATLDGPAVTGTLNATDGDGDAINWTISGTATNGTAAITASTSAEASLSYTPNPGFSGVDTFTVRAADGAANDTIEVTVVVRNPAALLWPAPVALWEFDFPAQPTLATIGANLVTQGTGVNPVAGAGFQDDGAQEIAVGTKFLAPNPVGSNGGGTFSNRYTLLWDVFIPTTSTGNFKTLLQTDPANVNDGDLFINPSGQIGTAAGLGGYSSNTIAGGNWYRVILRVINGQTNGATIWVNGVKWYTNTTTGGIDGRYGLENTFLLFADNDGEDGLIRTTNAAIWNDALSDTDIIALGSVHGRLTMLPRPAGNFPPVITEGASTPLTAQFNAATPITLHATDADGNPISWSVSTAAAHGSAVVTTATSAEATITYTPALNYTGTDSFIVSAADASLSDSILVNVTVVNGAPVIVEGETYSLNATKNGPARTATFHAADPDGNPLTWAISTPAGHGTAAVTGNNNTSGAISYTPATNYTGTDTFTFSVTDGALSDSITVNVSITDPASNPKLTIIAAHGTATPPPGVYPHPRGTPLTNSAMDEIGATTRHICTGWTMTGDGPSTGTVNTMNMTLNRDSVLTWTFLTEHRVETAVVGSGTVSVSSGWFEAGKPLQINAAPATGKYFVGWTGDTAGCITGGKSIVVPMDRPRSTITANFATNENFTFIALPDTQNYTSITNVTDLYTRQTQWILNNKDTMNIKFVTHLGDIVNSPSSASQWTRATDAMNLMNSRMPYGTCPGNHDLASGDTNYLVRFGPNPTHASSVGRWINPTGGQIYDWYRGSSPRGYSSYQIVQANGRDWMFLHMDMDAPDQDLAWAASVLNAHPKALTMVTTHNYLAESGGSGTYGSGTGQRGYTAQANIGTWGDRPDTNRPLDVFNAIVKPFNQVYMVICGHNFATYNLVKANNAGKNVHEVLVDWQSLPNGGNAYLRIMEFRPLENKIYNSSYSPYLGRYIDPLNNADHQGMLDLHDRYGSEFILDTDFDTRFNTNLTVVSAFGGVSPAVGTHSFETGSPIAITAQEQIVGQTRYRPTGWSLAGGQAASGLGSSAVITQGAAATLSWSYATEHYLTTNTTGAGIVSTSSGWYAAGSSVNIQAQPDAFASFIQWSGDIAGCTVNGATIAVQMDRPRGPITAQFTSPLPTYTLEVISAFPDVNPAPATYTYDQGQTITLSAADILGQDTRRICTGYTVTGDGETQTGTEKSVTITITKNLTWTWHWRTQYLLNTTVSGPGTLAPAGNQWIDENAPATLTATPGTGATFLSWSGDTAIGTAAGTQFSIAAMTRPVGPLTANFATGMHTLTVVSPQTTTTPAPGTYVVSYGSTIDFSALSAESNGTRQRPLSWTLSNGSTGTSAAGSVVISGDTTLTWTFTPEVLLTISGGAEGQVLPMDAAGWKPQGSTVTLEAKPSQWFTFRRWSGDVSSNSTNASINLLMDQPRSITPDFMPLTTGNGTPRWWLSEFSQVTGGNYEAASNNDSDHDGIPAGQEFIAGLSDLDSHERFQIQGLSSSPDGNSLVFTLPSREGRVYQLMGGTELGGTFSPIGAPIPPTPPAATVTVTKPAGDTSHFYSVRVGLGASTQLDSDPMATTHTPAPGSVLRNMVTIPARTFTQGEHTGPVTTRPEHPTYVSGFKMDKYEVTRADWEAIATWAQAHGYDIPVVLRYNQAPYNVPANHPAVALSWYDAVKWCNARSEMEGRRPAYFADTAATTVYRAGQIDLTCAHVNWAGDGYRLPTEAEWECASRGGIENALFPWGNLVTNLRANHWDYQVINGRAPDTAFPYTERVGFFDGTQPGGEPDMANGYGLYDMAGNAWEWTWDRMTDYTADKQYNPRGPDIGGQRVQRGGSWWNYNDQANNFQRLPFPPDGSDDYGMIGFRCVRALHPNE